MKLALIPPISWVSTSSVTNYQLMLPQLLRDHRYTDHYRALAKQSAQYVILDNGEAEGKNYLDSAQLVGAGIFYEVSEVVIPDVIQDQIKTISRMDQFFKDIYDLRNDAFGMADVKKLKFMGVAQGKSYPEVRDCIDIMMYAHGAKLSTLALPRHLVSTVSTGIRLSLAQYIRTEYGNVRIHCLGASPDFPEEMLELGKQGIVDGMDTSMPYNYASEGVYVDDPGWRISRPKHYFELRAGLFKTDCLHHNIGVMKRWASGTA